MKNLKHLMLLSLLVLSCQSAWSSNYNKITVNGSAEVTPLADQSYFVSDGLSKKFYSKDHKLLSSINLKSLTNQTYKICENKVMFSFENSRFSEIYTSAGSYVSSVPVNYQTLIVRPVSTGFIAYANRQVLFYDCDGQKTGEYRLPTVPNGEVIADTNLPGEPVAINEPKNEVYVLTQDTNGLKLNVLSFTGALKYQHLFQAKLINPIARYIPIARIDNERVGVEVFHNYVFQGYGYKADCTVLTFNVLTRTEAREDSLCSNPIFSKFTLPEDVFGFLKVAKDRQSIKLYSQFGSLLAQRTTLENGDYPQWLRAWSLEKNVFVVYSDKSIYVLNENLKILRMLTLPTKIRSIDVSASSNIAVTAGPEAYLFENYQQIPLY